MKPRVLIVDDDPRNIFALKATLRSRSYECITCDNAKDALRLLEKSDRPDVVLMDMMMPEMDGYEAIPLIRRLPGGDKLRVIAVTGQAMADDRQKCLDAGADEYVPKPVDVDRLLTLIEDRHVE
jgi:CheY-like chemotaxis protein